MAENVSGQFPGVGTDAVDEFDFRLAPHGRLGSEGWEVLLYQSGLAAGVAHFTAAQISRSGACWRSWRPPAGP